MPGGLSEEFDVLLAAVDTMEGELARSVLAAAGIPSMLHGPDFDIAELGPTAHMQIRKASLFVPKGARQAARTALVEAWGEKRVAAQEPH